MVRSLLELFSDPLGIDLGTANTLICDCRHGVVVNEPSVVAYESGSGKVIAAGSEAKQYLGRCPRGIEAVYPLREGVINHFNLAVQMLSTFLKKAHRRVNLYRNRIVISVPKIIRHDRDRQLQRSAQRREREKGKGQF